MNFHLTTWGDDEKHLDMFLDVGDYIKFFREEAAYGKLLKIFAGLVDVLLKDEAEFKRWINGWGDYDFVKKAIVKLAKAAGDSSLDELFKKVCINEYQATDENGVIMYRHGDLYQFAKDAAAKGEKYFYCAPDDPDNPCGKLHLSEPEYRWLLKERSGLTKEEYDSLIRVNHGE